MHFSELPYLGLIVVYDEMDKCLLQKKAPAGLNGTGKCRQIRNKGSILVSQSISTF